MEGWRFSSLDGRLSEDEPPWSFEQSCRRLLRQSRAVLDMGTGGGEQLLRYRPDLPPDTTATEGWPPNVGVAGANLATYAIPVVYYDADRSPRMPMPFRPGRFDLVINRHESYQATEVRRVLDPRGCFVTQQVGGDDAEQTRTWFGAPGVRPEWTLDVARAELVAAGLVVSGSAEWRGSYRFVDVASLLHYLALVPWDLPAGFAVDDHLDVLWRLHRAAAKGHGIRLTKSRWMIIARPGG